ncbi:hypothetical protein LEP1GSC060_1841 [Leptospira weilii serovar Ranarum str. ICFT]|uniref:Uncharacterized protein n=1 Tax=Leptospira weilii serovar Ranarum str. ICFT TaxID=1218598 RepID=N1WQJ9_9LEPT|nr:hypothetical protein [Leptospira weilii]EMY78093.1 hypothetical protein LEP1GSC060_1841 [Leptospira weilii serovar Ranarum str. ICFT]
MTHAIVNSNAAVPTFTKGSHEESRTTYKKGRVTLGLFYFCFYGKCYIHALNMALDQIPKDKKIIHHSD